MRNLAYKLVYNRLCDFLTFIGIFGISILLNQIRLDEYRRIRPELLVDALQDCKVGESLAYLFLRLFKFFSYLFLVLGERSVFSV